MLKIVRTVTAKKEAVVCPKRKLIIGMTYVRTNPRYKDSKFSKAWGTSGKGINSKKPTTILSKTSKIASIITRHHLPSLH